MSLREALRQAVARCAPQGTQHATTTPMRAHPRATTAQQHAASPHEYLLTDAHQRATPAQLPCCAPIEKGDRFVARVARVAQAGNPLMTAAQADKAHWPAWDGAEIDRAVSRIHLFTRRGIDADLAEHLAERLVLRDREDDDRRLCLECRHGTSDRCPDGAPLPADVLHCCPHFKGTP